VYYNTSNHQQFVVHGGSNNKKRKANPVDATIIEDPEPTTKKAKKL
jgi:hypothetical protein